MTGGSKADRRPRVLWVSPTLDSDFGGPTTTTVNGLIAEAGAGIDSRLVTTQGIESGSDLSATQVGRLRSGGVPVLQFRRSRAPKSAAWGLSPRMLLWMLRELRSFDAVHLQYVWCATTLWGCLLARVSNVRVVLTPHESLTAYDIGVASGNRLKAVLKKALRRFVLRSVDAVIVMSELERAQTDSAETRTVLIRHALVEQPSYPRERPAAEPDGPLTIAFLGRNVPKKGIERLIRALADERASGWRLLVAGPPGDTDRMERLARLSRDSGVSDRVRWLGFVESVSYLFDRSDVLVMPSEYEGFGMVAAEAMAAGLPVIVPRLSGVAELVADFEAGLLIERPSESCLLEALTEFDRCRDEWPRLGRNGTRAVNELLTFAGYSAATGSLYESLVGDSGSGEDRARADIDSTSATGR